MDAVSKKEPAHLSRFLMLLIPIGLLILLVGCAAVKTSDPGFLKEYLSRSYPASKELCFKATLRAFGQLHIKVSKADLERGIIVTERSEFLRAALASERSPSQGSVPINQQHKYSLVVTGTRDECQVASTKYQVLLNGVESEKIGNLRWGRENIWDPLFKMIEAQILEPR